MRGAAVEGMCGEPDGVFHLVKYIQFAALGFGTERFKYPVGSALAMPGDGVPMAVGVDIPKVEVVSVNLELGSRHYPVGSRVVEVHGIDGRGMWGVFHSDVHGDEAVAVSNVLVGPVVGPGHGIGISLMVGIDDLVSARIPEILVAGLLLRNGESIFVMFTDGEMQRGFTFAAERVDVMVCVDGAFREGHVDVEIVVEPTVVVTARSHDVVVIVGPQLEVENYGAVAGISEM